MVSSVDVPKLPKNSTYNSFPRNKIIQIWDWVDWNTSHASRHTPFVKGTGLFSLQINLTWRNFSTRFRQILHKVWELLRYFIAYGILLYNLEKLIQSRHSKHEIKRKTHFTCQIKSNFLYFPPNWLPFFYKRIKINSVEI